VVSAGATNTDRPSSKPLQLTPRQWASIEHLRTICLTQSVAEVKKVEDEALKTGGQVDWSYTDERGRDHHIDKQQAAVMGAYDCSEKLKCNDKDVGPLVKDAPKCK